MGRPALHFDTATRERVAILAASGLKQTVIARQLGIHRNTLHRCLRDEVAVGAAKRHLAVVEAMYEAALRGNVAAARYYLSGALGRHRG